jgi:AcrR family transcriptional regulator
VILASARALLLDRGGAGTTIAELKRHTGVGPGTLYHHFPREDRQQPGTSTLERVIDEALRGLLGASTDHLIDELAATLREDAHPDVQALLLREFRLGRPLVRVATDPGLSAGVRYRRRISDAMDRVIHFLSGQVPSGQVPSGQVPSGQVPSQWTDSGQEAIGDAVALVAFVLGLVTLERVYQGPGHDSAVDDDPAGDDPRSKEDRDLDLDVLLGGGYQTLKRRAATIDALTQLRRILESGTRGTGDR